MPLEDTRLADRPQPIEDTLLDNVTANTTGTWKPGQRRRPTHISIEGVNGTFSATVTIYGSLQRARPADNDTAGRPVLMIASSQGQSFVVDAPYSWYKAVVTAFGSGIIFSGFVAG